MTTTWTFIHPTLGKHVVDLESNTFVEKPAESKLTVAELVTFAQNNQPTVSKRSITLNEYLKERAEKDGVTVTDVDDKVPRDTPARV